MVVQIEAEDTGWNPVALGTLEVPGIAVALACWRLHPPAMARQGRTSAAEYWRWSAGASQSSDIAPERVYSGTGDSEWTRSRVAGCTAEVAAAEVRDTLAACWRPDSEAGICAPSVSPRLSNLSFHRSRWWRSGRASMW